MRTWPMILPSGHCTCVAEPARNTCSGASALDGGDTGDDDGSLHAHAGVHRRALATAGTDVEKGGRLRVVEAMRMEHTIVVPAAGRLSACRGYPWRPDQREPELVQFDAAECDTEPGGLPAPRMVMHDAVSP